MDFEQILKRFPFLSIIKAGEKEYVGIIQQSDTAFIMFYDYSLIKDKKLKETFISLGETWWWESNRRIPITLFLHKQMKEFYPYLTVLSAKNVKIEPNSLSSFLLKIKYLYGIFFFLKIFFVASHCALTIDSIFLSFFTDELKKVKNLSLGPSK